MENIIDRIKKLSYEDRDILISKLNNIKKEERPLVKTPFSSIRKCDPVHLVTMLQQEHPQMIAVVLSYLEPNKASVVLDNLPQEMQSDILRRICLMDYILPETIRDVEKVLEKRLNQSDIDEKWVSGGICSAVEILNLVNAALKKRILENLEDEYPGLVEDIKNRMFVFEDIVMLDDRAIHKVMREVDSQELAKSLYNVDSEVQNKIFRNMSKRAATMLKEDMEYMGPIRLKDVDEAQQKVASIVRHLEDTGEIIVGRVGEDEMIVPNLEDEKGFLEDGEIARQCRDWDYLEETFSPKAAKYIWDKLNLLNDSGSITYADLTLALSVCERSIVGDFVSVIPFWKGLKFYRDISKCNPTNMYYLQKAQRDFLELYNRYVESLPPEDENKDKPEEIND